MWFFKNYGILWQNARNLYYIGEFNDRIAKELADSKLHTKEFLAQYNIPVPQTLHIVTSHKELENFSFENFSCPFVIKPNRGYGGKGILIVEKKNEQGRFITTDGKEYTEQEMLSHMCDILDGFYSLSGKRDRVIFEKKIQLDTSIELLGKYGLPDIRVIVFNCVPVIAMLRVPTENSHGKANLHAWACGVGIDIGNGRLTHIIQFWKYIRSIPGIGDIRSIQLPKWEEVLKLAVKVQQVTKIGYLGCDIVLDDRDGPMVVEINVRPWLEVQLANKAPLLDRLKKLEKIKVYSVEKWVRLWRDLFWWDVEEQIRTIVGKKIVGMKEFVFLHIWEKVYSAIASIVPSQKHSCIQRNYLQGMIGSTKEIKKEQLFSCEVDWMGERKKISFVVKDIDCHVIIGKKDLWDCFIDPWKYKETDLPIDYMQLKQKNIVIRKGYEEQLKRIDAVLMEIDKKLNILHYVTPTNIQSESLRFVESEGEYIPRFTYSALRFSFKEIEETLKSLTIPEIPLASLFLKKKQEIQEKLLFLQAFEQQDLKTMYVIGKKLFWEIHKENVEYARSIIFHKPPFFEQKQYVTIEDIQNIIAEFNDLYHINIAVKIKETGARFALKWNKLLCSRNNILLGKHELRSIIAHEIESHFLRRKNGEKTGYQIFTRGTAYYLSTEEGIAIYNQNRFLTPYDQKYYGFLERYYFLDFATKHSYQELIEEYKKFYPQKYKLIFNYLVRIKRGITKVEAPEVFMKDVVYLNGFLEINDFIKKWGILEDLYFWKIHVSDLEEIKKHSWFLWEKEDKIIPLFL